MPAVLVIGFITIDFVVHVDALAGTVVPEQARELDVACGGRAANQAMALAAVEAQPALLARVGSDEHAAVLITELVDLGIDVSAVEAAPEATGVRLISQLPDREHAISVYRGANDHLSVDDLNRRTQVIGAAGAVGVTTEPAGAITLRALEIARQAGVPTVLTHAPTTRTVSDRVLSAADVVVTSVSTCTGLLDPGVAATSPEAAVRAIVQRGAPAVVLLAQDRALLATADDVRQVPSPGRLDSEDAVDAFAGGLLVGLANGEPVTESVLRGVRTSCLLID